MFLTTSYKFAHQADFGMSLCQMMSTTWSRGSSMIDINGQCWRATRRQVMSSYGCQVRYLWLAIHVENPYLEGSFFGNW